MLLLRFFDTFSKIRATNARTNAIEGLNDRERLIVLMRTMGYKLNERKRLLRRIKTMAHGSPYLIVNTKRKNPPTVNMGD